MQTLQEQYQDLLSEGFTPDEAFETMGLAEDQRESLRKAEAIQSKLSPEERTALLQEKALNTLEHAMDNGNAAIRVRAAEILLSAQQKNKAMAVGGNLEQALRRRREVDAKLKLVTMADVLPIEEYIARSA